MTKLIEALTGFLIEATAYLARQNGATKTLGQLQAEGMAAVAEEPVKKERKARTPKAEAVATPQAPEMSEAESSTEVLAVTRAYVARFQKHDPDGQKRALAILASADFGVPGIKSLSHTQRMAFIARLKSEMAASDRGVV